MSIAELLKKNFVLVPVIASILVGTFTGVKYIVSLTETINQNRDQIAIINDKHLKNQIGYIAIIQEKLCTVTSDGFHNHWNFYGR
jgi:hypothetical protein